MAEYKYTLIVYVATSEIETLKRISSDITKNFHEISGQTDMDIKLVYETGFPLEVTTKYPITAEQKSRVAEAAKEFYQKEFGENYEVTTKWMKS